MPAPTPRMVGQLVPACGREGVVVGVAAWAMAVEVAVAVAVAQIQLAEELHDGFLQRLPIQLIPFPH